MPRHASASRPCNVLLSGPRFTRHHAYGQDTSCAVGVPDCKARNLCVLATSRVARRNHFCEEVPCCTAVVAAGAAALLVGGCQLSSPLRDGLDRSCCQKASCTRMHHEHQHSRALRCQLFPCQELCTGSLHSQLSSEYCSTRHPAWRPSHPSLIMCVTPGVRRGGIRCVHGYGWADLAVLGQVRHEEV